MKDREAMAQFNEFYYGFSCSIPVWTIVKERIGKIHGRDRGSG